MTVVEQEIELIEEEDVDMENIVKKKKTPNESKNSATIKRKQRLKSLDDVLNDNDYDNAPPERSFEYTDSKKKVKMEWKTNKEEQITKEELRMCR